MAPPTSPLRQQTQVPAENLVSFTKIIGWPKTLHLVAQHSSAGLPRTQPRRATNPRRHHAPGDVNRPVGLLVSSMDSLLSIDDGRQVDLPPAINFSQQQIPDRLLQPEGESETSSSTGLSDSSKEESTRREKSRERDTKSSRGRHERVRRCENSERTHKVTKTRTSKDAAQPPVGRTTPVQLSHPVIAIRTRNEQPNKLTSSLLRPIRDVLPSKPLSPVARAPVKFSYTMHSGSRKSK